MRSKSALGLLVDLLEDQPGALDSDKEGEKGRRSKDHPTELRRP